jgi:hypothetical protein
MHKKLYTCTNIYNQKYAGIRINDKKYNKQAPVARSTPGTMCFHKNKSHNIGSAIGSVREISMGSPGYTKR